MNKINTDQIKVIFFDFDDVLAYPDASENLYEILNIKEEELDSAVEEVIEEKEGEYQYLPTVEDELKYMRSYYKSLLERLNLDDSQLPALMERHMRPRKILFPGVLELLEKLQQHYVIGMISNAFPSRRLNEFDRLGLTKYFEPDLIIISAEVGYWKPDIKIFKLALKKIKVDPQNTLYIDDKEKYLNAAKKAGVNSLIRISEKDDSEYQTIPKVTDLLKLLEL